MTQGLYCIATSLLCLQLTATGVAQTGNAVLAIMKRGVA